MKTSLFEKYKYQFTFLDWIKILKAERIIREGSNAILHSEDTIRNESFKLSKVKPTYNLPYY